jgi:hypothetical protein
MTRETLGLIVSVLRKAIELYCFDLCIRVKIDAPWDSTLIAEDATYQDPMGFVAEMFHFCPMANLSKSQGVGGWQM